ncbi:TonB-dependent receptor [Ilyomonas limi]|uniref:TonB-dependent receptor n=2 Tax=Ilyomonas limi TaxID=2575867 RepID=A0A4U3KX78_9BACT|nr:TonB-dependent receptor [Ilyomonas limi]
MRCFAMLFLLFIGTGAFAQRQVTGKVISGTDNAPVGYATVAVKGTKVATLTNADGTFSLTMPAGRTTLVISSVGYEDQEVNAESGTVSVTLKTRTSSLDEIVVTGYTAQKKKEVTGAVSIVNVKEMKQVPAGTGEEALQGRASGVTIVTSGQPGAASDIRIRGFSGFGSNQPLIIIDGVHGDLHNINVNDIESVQVLKDASAAIYGVQGSNGVIIITTKRGRSGKAVVTYDGYYGVTTPGPGYNMASPTEAANAIWQQQRNSGIANPTSKQYGSGANPVVPDYLTPTGYTLCNCPTDSQFVAPSLYDINSYQITRANKAGTNWYKEITRNAPIQSHNVSVSSGSDKSSYYFSLGYLNQQGIMKFQYLERYSVRANTQFTIKDKIRVGENAYIFYSKNPTFGNQGEGSPFTTAYREDPIIPIYDIMGNFAGTKSQDLGNARNPYADIYRTKDNVGNRWDITGNVFAEVDFLKHFTARTSFGGSVNNNYGYNFNYVGYENAEGNTGANSFSENASYNTQWTFTNTLTYSNTFGEHTVRALLGTEAFNSYGRGLGGTRSNYFSENPDYWTLNTGSPSGQSNTGYAYQSSLWSQFAKLEYNYAGKYLLNGTLRRDGSSVFAEEVRYGYFPSISAGWVISQENFMKGVSFINNLKIRYSWGKMGIANADPTNAYNLYSSRAGKSFYDLTGSSTVPLGGFYRSNLGNPGAKWEGDIISNIGFDATILKNKLDVTIDWYKKKVSGLLFTATGTQYDVVFVGDAALPKINVGDMQNTGIDGSITYHATIQKDLKIDVTGTLTSYNNKIVDIPGAGYFSGPTIRNAILQRYEEGHPVGAFYGYQVIGLFQSEDDIAKSPDQDGAKPGLFKYQDVNNDGKITADDRTYIGNPNPDFTYGLNIAISYKAIDFSAFFFGSKGNDIYNNTLYFTDFPDFFKGGIRKEVALNSWTPERTNTNIPAMYTTGSFSSDQTANSYFISKGSYFRAKQMQIGYTLPASTLSRFGVDRLRIYVQSANLFTITKYQGLDPELQSVDPNGNSSNGFGTDQGNYPHTPSFLVGVNLNF